jgi:type II secretory pathway component GspD/PulD (secretin)
VRRIALVLALTACLASAEEALVSRTFPLGHGNAKEIKDTVSQILSSRGKIVVLPAERQILIVETAEQMDLVTAVLRELTAPKPNVRIEVTLNEGGTEGTRGIDVRGRVGGNDLTIGNAPVKRGTIEVDVLGRSGGSGSLSSQFLMVQSGGEAFLEVGQDVPLIDYFYTLALGAGYVAPEIRWQRIGTRLGIRPMVSGNLIQVEVMPQVTALVNAEWQVIRYRELATTVTVTDGETLQIGGFSKASEEFNRNFFSRGSSRAGGSGTFTLKASIQRPGGP